MCGRFWRGGVVVLLLVAACARQPTPTPTPVVTAAPTVDNALPGGNVTASGEVAPTGKAILSFPAAGRVQTIETVVGETVAAGAPLVTLERASAQAEVAQAQAALFQAQAQLAAIVAGPRPQEIERAKADLAATQAQLDALTEPARPAEVAAARAAVTAAQAALQQLSAGPQEEERIAALATLSNAKAALQQAQSAYNKVSWANDIGARPESRQLQEATNNYEAAQARYDALFAGPTADQAAAARAQLQQAQATLTQLLTPGSPSQIAAAEAQVRSAQATFDLLTAAARDETIATASATVAAAEAVLQRAEATLAHTALHAPFAGTVTAVSVNVGEMVQPGQVVLTLADLTHLEVTTTDLSERDIGRVQVGQAATVFIEALGDEFPGKVTRIADQATIIGGDVVYPVTIQLDAQPPGLRWGMSAQVEIQTTE
ncbi:MAG: HlyD family efflux transporter periplasmic adaptor subunit [Caldilinea sp. CFX5]|nr:HlyD family efflux transporter periplasmic adaptor subunit [Caldilinea sp. CFX5]